MTVLDDIAVIEADQSKTANEKRRAIYVVKSTSISTALAPFVGGSYNYQGRRYTLGTVLVDANGTLIIDLIVRNGTSPTSPVIFADLLKIINPPVLVPGALPRTFVLDLIEAGRQILRSVVP